MAEQMRPASPQQAPDPSFNYERSHPGREAGLGRLDAPPAAPAEQPDGMEQAVTHKQDPTRQINAHEVTDARRDGTTPPRGGAAPDQPDHSMKDEEPLGWDQAPTDIHDPSRQRHPKIDGRGGTP